MPAKINLETLLKKPDVQKLIEYWGYSKNWIRYRDLREKFVRPRVPKKGKKSKKNNLLQYKKKDGIFWLDPVKNHRFSPSDFLYTWENQLERKLDQMVEYKILERKKEKNGTNYRLIGNFANKLLQTYHKNLLDFPDDNILPLNNFNTIYFTNFSRRDLVNSIKAREIGTRLKYINSLAEKIYLELNNLSEHVKYEKIINIWTRFIHDNSIHPLLKFYYSLMNSFFNTLVVESIRYQLKREEYKDWGLTFDKMLTKAICNYLVKRYEPLDYHTAEKTVDLGVNREYKNHEKKIDKMQEEIYDLFHVGFLFFMWSGVPQFNSTQSEMLFHHFQPEVDSLMETYEEKVIGEFKDLSSKEGKDKPIFLVDSSIDSAKRKSTTDEGNFFVENNFFQGFDKELNELKIVGNVFRQYSVGDRIIKHQEFRFKNKRQMYNVLNNYSRIFFMPKLPDSQDELLKWKV